MEKEKNKFTITRVFDAPIQLIWDVHTKEEHMAKWWGPKGFKMIKAKIDLKPDGIFHYGMQGPDGNIMWGKLVYKEIVPITKLVFVVSFSDENAGITRHPMAPAWPAETLNTMELKEENGKTVVTISGYPINSSADEDALFYSAFDGMNQGFKGTYDQLEEYLKTV